MRLGLRKGKLRRDRYVCKPVGRLTALFVGIDPRWRNLCCCKVIEQGLEPLADFLEAALWKAVRTFREKSVLARQLALRHRDLGHADSSQRFEAQARLDERYGEVIQQYLLQGVDPPVGQNRPEANAPREAAG